MKVEIDIKCPACEHTIKVALGNMRPGNSRDCPRCRRRINFTGDDGSKVQRNLDQATKDVEQTVRDLNRKLKF